MLGCGLVKLRSSRGFHDFLRVNHSNVIEGLLFKPFFWVRVLQLIQVIQLSRVYDVAECIQNFAIDFCCYHLFLGEHIDITPYPVSNLIFASICWHVLRL